MITHTPDILPPPAYDEQPTAPSRPWRDWLFYLVMLVCVIGFTAALSMAGTAVGYTLILAGLILLVLVLLIARWPIVGFYVVAVCAVLIESEPLPNPIITDQLYVFYWPPHFTGLPERPIGFLILFIFFILICQRLIRRERVLEGGPLLWPFLGLMACIAIGVLHGLAGGGQFKVIILEIRPFIYLFECYLLAYNVVTEKRQVRNLLWILIIGSDFKALQGVYIVYADLGGHISGHNQIMAHEQSFFWVAVLLLIVLFSLHSRYRPQLIAALVPLPFILIALLANNRRADYAAFAVGAVLAWIMVIIVRPGARKRLITGLAVCGVLAVAYVLAFQHVPGSLGSPAHSVMAIIHPSATDVRDQLSNLYRTNEDYDLKYTERQSPLLGYGYGKPFLQPAPLPDIAGLDPIYLYVPHNTIIWIWMRLGPLGYFALWFLFGSILLLGCRIARQLRDPYLQLVAIFAVSAMVMEIMVAYADYQLFFYRNVMFMGLLIGVLLRLPSIESRQPPAEPEDTDANPRDRMYVRDSQATPLAYTVSATK